MSLATKVKRVVIDHPLTRLRHKTKEKKSALRSFCSLVNEKEEKTYARRLRYSYSARDPP